MKLYRLLKSKYQIHFTARDWNEIFTTITWMQLGGFALRGVDEDEFAALFCCALTPLTA